MGKVAADITVSLDGFVAGPNDGPELGLGEGGERLHEWLFELESFHRLHGRTGGVTNEDNEVLNEVFRRAGAVLVGRRMFDNARGWGDHPPFHMPVFVLTHESRDVLVKDDTTFTFVTDGIESAVEQAKAAAGDKDVSIGGGASTIQQCLKAGLLDEIQVHLVPVLLGGGIRLFDEMGTEPMELEPTRLIASPAVTHLRFSVVK
jgi:dihydrofolate reductase